MISLACLDWEARIRAGQSLIPPGARAEGVVNDKIARDAIGIFNKLRLPDVPGTPALATAAGDWFREIVGVFLGCVDAGGERLIRELFLLAAKKSSKTSYGAALMMTALIMNKRPRAEFLLIAPTQAISELAFSQAAGMRDADPEGFLQKRLHPQDHLKTITDRRTKAQLKIKTFDTSVLTGVKPAGVLLDELHEISRNARAAAIIRQIRGGLLPIPEAFLAFITTQSDEPPAGAFKAELMTARAIRDGRATGAMMPVLYEFPESIIKDKGQPPAWQDPANWPMVTPNLGRSVTIERLIPEFETAKAKGEAELRGWASQHLNVEIGVGLYSDRWRGADHWAARADRTLTLDSLLKRCEIAVAGVDGGGLDDLLALCVLGRETGTRRWLAWHHTWAHRGVLELRKSEAARLEDFAAAGELTLVEDMMFAFGDLVSTIQVVEDSGLLDKVGLDPVGVGIIVEGLAEIGIGGDRVIGIGQGWKMNGAIKTAEVKLASGELVHGGQAITAWAAGNCKVEARSNAIVITKQAAGTAKIDPIMALLDGVALMTATPKSTTLTEADIRFL